MHKIICVVLSLFIHTTAYASINLFAYVSNAAAQSYLSVCAINSATGQFDSCTPLYLEHLSAPISLAVATIAQATYAYISNNTYPDVIIHCLVNNEGMVHACTPTDVPSFTGITLHQSDALYAYLAYSDSIKKCRITLGQLKQEDCHDSGAGKIFSNGPVYLSFATFNQRTFAYIANGDYQIKANVMQCTVQHNGDFTDCKDSGAGADLKGAADVDFAHINGKTYAYLTQPQGIISKCTVDSHNGLLSHCAPTGGSFHAPLGLSVITVADTLYAYVVDGGFRQPVANVVYQCLIDTSGNLNCADSGVGQAFSNPFDIALLTQPTPQSVASSHKLN